MDPLIPAYVDALAREIAEVGRQRTGIAIPVVSIYFGGGTPSLLTTAHFEQVLSAIYTHFVVHTTVEVTFEANPNDLTESQSLRRLCDIGVNRLSIGMQSAINTELQGFNRRHTNEMTGDAIRYARQGGFKNINLDLIFGFPGQTFDNWRVSLQSAMDMEPEHISLYALGLEPGTDLEYAVREGLQIMPADDLSADMYELASKQLFQSGFIQYEISNWARPGYECRHNLQYWRNDMYLGFGAGAHGYANNQRYEVIRNPIVYINKLSEIKPVVHQFPHSSVVQRVLHVSRGDEISETLITNLRLLQEGLNRNKFQERFGTDILETHGHILEPFAELRLLSITPDTIRLTGKGRLLSNVIFRELI